MLGAGSELRLAAAAERDGGVGWRREPGRRALARRATRRGRRRGRGLELGGGGMRLSSRAQFQKTSSTAHRRRRHRARSSARCWRRARRGKSLTLRTRLRRLADGTSASDAAVAAGACPGSNLREDGPARRAHRRSARCHCASPVPCRRCRRSRRRPAPAASSISCGLCAAACGAKLSGGRPNAAGRGRNAATTEKRRRDQQQGRRHDDDEIEAVVQHAAPQRPRRARRRRRGWRRRAATASTRPAPKTPILAIMKRREAGDLDLAVGGGVAARTQSSPPSARINEAMSPATTPNAKAAMRNSPLRSGVPKLATPRKSSPLQAISGEFWRKIAAEPRKTRKSRAGDRGSASLTSGS